MGSVQLFIEKIAKSGNQNTWRSQYFDSEDNDFIPNGILYLLVCVCHTKWWKHDYNVWCVDGNCRLYNIWCGWQL